MNRVEFLKSFSCSSDHPDSTSLYSAFVNCLTAEEASELLVATLLLEPDRRHVVARKVHSDLENELSDCHLSMVDRLIVDLGNLHGPKTQIYGAILYDLCDGLPKSHRQKVIDALISSKYINLRRRAYKLLRSDWQNEFRDTLLQAWSVYSDKQCAQLMIQKLPLQDILTYYDQLVPAVEGSFGTTRLYIRLGEDDPSILSDLQRSDAITYAYVLTKLGRALTFEEAITIAERNCTDDRFGLFLWCLGKMRLWNALLEIHRRLHKYSTRRRKALLKRITTRVELDASGAAHPKR